MYYRVLCAQVQQSPLYFIKSRPRAALNGLYIQLLLLLCNAFGFHKLRLVFSYVLNTIVIEMIIALQLYRVISE